MVTHYKQYQMWLLPVVFTLTLLFPRSGRSADVLERPLEKITIAYSSISANMATLWITQERGFFRKYGLDVQLVFIESGTTTVQSLISKEVAFAQMAGAGVLQSRLRGSDVVLIAGFLNTMDYQLMVDKSITRPDQLKGKIMAVSRFGSSSDFATRYALETYGLVPGKDVTLVQIGSQPECFAALASGRIQGALIAIPVTAKAKKAGFNTLADLQMLGLEYPQNGLAVTQGLIKSKPALIRNMTKAFVEAIHYFKTHRKETLAIYRKYLKTDDMEALEETYEAVGLNLVPEKPYPTMKGIRIVLKEMASKNPKAEAATPDQFVDLTFIRELDKSGFIDRLYKAQPVVASREDAGSSPASPVIKEKPKPGPVKEAASIARGASSLPQTYTVTAGDTLSHLAFRFYGSSNKWPQIHQANADTLKNPNYLYIGQQLLIPPDGKRGG